MTNILAIAGIVVKELYRRKDFYVLFILTGLITLTLGSVNFFNDDKIVGYLKEITLLLIWISSLVLAVITSARQIPAERESRTIFPLLAKPISRGELLVGKFAGCWAASSLCLLVFYLFFAVVIGAREHHLPLLGYAQAWVLHCMLLGIVVALVTWGSLVFAAPSSNSTICLVLVLGILLLGRHLNKVALGMAQPMRAVVQCIYFAIPHLEFFDLRAMITHNLLPIPWGVWLEAIGYGIFYAGLFLILGWMAFRKKSLAT